MDANFRPGAVSSRIHHSYCTTIHAIRVSRRVPSRELLRRAPHTSLSSEGNRQSFANHHYRSELHRLVAKLSLSRDGRGQAGALVSVSKPSEKLPPTKLLLLLGLERQVQGHRRRADVQSRRWPNNSYKTEPRRRSPRRQKRDFVAFPSVIGFMERLREGRTPGAVKRQ